MEVIVSGVAACVAFCSDSSAKDDKVFRDACPGQLCSFYFERDLKLITWSSRFLQTSLNKETHWHE